MIGSRTLNSLSVSLGRGLRERGLTSSPIGFPVPARTAKDRRRLYEQDGFVLGERLLDRVQLGVLRAEFDRLFAGRNEPGAEVRQRPVETGSAAYYCLYELREHSAAFDALARDPRLVRMLSDLTGLESFLLVLDQVQYKPPRVGGENGWHRDMPTFPLIRPYTAITAWVALDDATHQSGCMDMVPGSHRWGRRKRHRERLGDSSADGVPRPRGCPCRVSAAGGLRALPSRPRVALVRP